MTSIKKTAQWIWEESKAGRLEKKVKKFFSSADNGARWTDKDQRWIDKHRAKSLTAESEIVAQFEKAQLEVKAEYKNKFEKHMIDVYQGELDYLSEVEKRPVPTKE